MMAASITHTGETPKSQMSRAAMMGIQQLLQVTLAAFAIRNTGAAIIATTAGRSPMKICSTTALSRSEE